MEDIQLHHLTDIFQKVYLKVNYLVLILSEIIVAKMDDQSFHVYLYEQHSVLVISEALVDDISIKLVGRNLKIIREEKCTLKILWKLFP